MGRLRRELTDPWGVLLAGTAGGVAAVLSGGLVGVGVAAAVYGVKVASAALFDEPDEAGSSRALAPPRPEQGSAAAFWLGRAEQAVAQLDDMARGVGGASPTDAVTAHAAAEADVVLDTMRRLAGQSVAVADALRRVDGADLEGEAARLRELATRSPDDDSARRSAEAVADRLAVRDRLRRAAGALDGRLQSSALGLEGVVARVAEVRAAAAAVGELDPTADDLASLTADIEGLRVGLADVESAAQRALGGA